MTELAEKIRQSAIDGKEIQTNLATNDRIIARVTDGIYREPWAAFRELIANAYDADATNVIVETGAPEFEKVIVRDDGNGMSPDILAYVLENIGGSSKRTATGIKLKTARSDDALLSPAGRQLIGKIGIGLFAVAQLTQHFQIITKSKGSELRSSATVLLKTHDEKQLEQADSAKKYTAGIATIKSEIVPDDEIDAHGTTIILYQLRPEIRKSMQSLPTWNACLAEGIDGEPVREKPIFHTGILPGLIDAQRQGLKEHFPWKPDDEPSVKFEKLVEAAETSSGKMNKPANLDHFDEYLKLIWKLSLALPLRYIHQHPFDADGSSKIRYYSMPTVGQQALKINLKKNEKLRDKLNLSSGNDLSKFDVFLDDIMLRRPIELPEILRKDHRIKSPVMLVSSERAPFSDDEIERAGGELEFEAYLYWNSKIVPKDTQGVLIRVKEASGTLFDPTFLKYQVSEQTRLRQITAEIFVTNGLDSAINIDRESFNFSHPHYLYIQRWLHKALRLLVNRLKALAKEDLEAERALQKERATSTRISKAQQVWRARLGTDSEIPSVAKVTDAKPIVEVGDVEIEWPVSQPIQDNDLSSALAIILEAYGVLSNLSAKDRGKLINDIIDLFAKAP